jgi:serine/threonine protein kinase
VPSLQKLSQSLRCVSLGRNFIGDDGTVSLSAVLLDCQLLQRLDLSDNQIGSRGATALSKVFSSCATISEVVLSKNPFGDAGGDAIATAFQQCSAPNVEILQMSHCDLSSSSMRAFAAAFLLQSKMISLDLSWNNIDSVGAVCICESLSTHVCIQNVELSHNHIGDAGIVAVSQCLSSFNFSITRIGLENNGITTSGAVQFLSLLHSRKGLEYISLGQLDPCGLLQSVMDTEAWQRTGLPTPPDEVREWIPGLAFIHEALVSGQQTVRRMRFMLIGHGLAGKTRLAGALLNNQANTYPDVNIENRTIGIDCAFLRMDAPSGGIDIEVWDFAGQEVSYLSHTQYFSARRCLYLLVWSPFQPPPLDGSAASRALSFASVDTIAQPLILWMEILFLHVPDAQFVLCGTHAAAAIQHSEADYAALTAAVEALVRQKIDDLAALGRAELRDLKRRRQDLEAKLRSVANSLPSNAAVANVDEVELWNKLSRDDRQPRSIRTAARDAAKDATLLRSVRARTSAIQSDATVPPSCRKLQLLDCACVDSSDGSGIADLRRVLVSHCEGMPVLSEEIPSSWVVVESLFASMHTKLGNVISRDDAVSFLKTAMSDLQQPWEAIEFWGYLGRVFIYESSSGSAQQFWIVPDMMFLLDLIRPLIHWDPPRILTINPEFCVASALEPHSDDRNAAEKLLADLKRTSILHRHLLQYLAKWNSLQAAQQDAMLDFFHKCHLICALDDSPVPLCVSFQSQASSFLVTARFRDMSARLPLPVPTALDLHIYHAQFCLPLLHDSFLMRIQSRVLGPQTSIKLCVQLQQDCLFVRRSTSVFSKFYCCIHTTSSDIFSSVQQTFSTECTLHEDYKHVIHVHSDDLGLFQVATQVIEETLATMFSGLRYKSYVLAERDKVTGLGVWLQLGQMSLPTFSEMFKKNWFEEFCPGYSLHSLFPHKRCPIFISHSWSDGTEAFVRLLRSQLQEESLAAVGLDSAFFDQSACAVQNAFRSGLCEAAVVIVCLTPRYVTRPNCLKEFQWALDLSERKRLSVVFLPLHPALTYDGIKSMLKHKVVYVSAKDDASCRLFPLSQLAAALLNRYLLEHMGSIYKKWSEMKAWLSDGPSGELDDAALASETRLLVSRPVVSDCLAIECCADENESLCKDLKEELKELNCTVDFSKDDISQDHLRCFSPAFYPEESAARFFWSFSETLKVREAGLFARFRWRDILVSVQPHVRSNAKSSNDVSFQVVCESVSADAELKLLPAVSSPCEDPKFTDKILLSAILLPVGTFIDKVRVEDASKRERWLHVLKNLLIHEMRASVVQVQSRTHVLESKTETRTTSTTACDLYISTCRHATVSAGRNIQLYLNAIMDSMVHVVASQDAAAEITFRFGNFMSESSAGTAASAKTRVFLLTGDIASALLGKSRRCRCEGCQEIYHHVDVNNTGSMTPATFFVLVDSLSSDNSALLQVFSKCIIQKVSFVGHRISDCIPGETYVEGSTLNTNIRHLLDEHNSIQNMMMLQQQEAQKRIQNMMMQQPQNFLQRFKQNKANAARADEIAKKQSRNEFLIISDDELEYDSRFAPVSGNFGDVRKAMWHGIPVAVKTLKRNMSEEDRQNFDREARLMHSVNHPSCVRLYGLSSATNSASLVIEWMDGGDLSIFLKQLPPPPMHRRISLFRQICAGLCYLHSQKSIVHSDIKAANILLSADSKTAKIADFGLSKIRVQGAYASSASMQGTINYLPPERVLENAVSDRSADVYAMGALFWELLSCSVMWDGMSLVDISLALLQNKRPAIPSWVDADTARLIEECWASDPMTRPSALDLWRRVSVLDINNPEFNKPLDPYSSTFSSTCLTLEECLRKALDPATFDVILLDLHLVDSKYKELPLQSVIRQYGLKEVEAKCIIMYTLESPRVSRDQQLYKLFCQAYRQRDEEALDAFADFSFHFWNGLSKLPDLALPLYRGLNKRLTDINDLYHEGNIIHWHYPSSCTTDKRVASLFSYGGTLISLVNVTKAKSIQVFSLIEVEREFFLDFTSTFDVTVSLSCERVQALQQFSHDLPGDVDLVVLSARAHDAR